MDGYKIENISYTTIMRFKDCFDKNDSPKKEERIKWQFLENPIDNKYVDIAIDLQTNETAAIYAIFPVKFYIENKTVVGSQSLDTMTDKNHRGKGLFIKLAKNVYQKAQNDGLKLVYGFPNGNSNHGFEKKLNWKNLDPVPFIIRPLKTKYFTSRISLLSFLPNIDLLTNRTVRSKEFTFIEKFEFPTEINNIWTNFKKSFKISIERDVEYLTWRYLKKPLEKYRICHIYSKANEYLGFVVFTIKKKHGGTVGYIMECIYNQEVPQVGNLLIKYAVNEINKANADCVLSWCFEHSPNFKAYSKNNFFKMPEKLRPIELHFGVRSFDDVLSPIFEKRENWYLSYSDSDTV